MSQLMLEFRAGSSGRGPEARNGPFFVSEFQKVEFSPSFPHVLSGTAARIKKLSGTKLAPGLWLLGLDNDTTAFSTEAERNGPNPDAQGWVCRRAGTPPRAPYGTPHVESERCTPPGG